MNAPGRAVTLHSQLAKRGLARLTLRWPQLRSALLDFKAPTDDFESLCAAYEEACQALDIWRQSTAETAELRATEYQHLVKDIELDLIQYLARRAS